MNHRTSISGLLRALALAALLALGAPTASAVSDGAAFATLRANLILRRTNDFGGTLDKTAKKQKAAVLRAIADIESEPVGLATDVGIAASALKTLSAAYKDEFAATPPGTLPLLFGDLFSALAASVETARDALTARLASLDAKTAAKVQKKLDAATAAVTAARAATTPKDRFAKLSAAMKAIVAGGKAADKASGGGGGGDGTHALVNGAAWDSDSAQSEVYAGDDALQIFATRTIAGGTKESIYLVVKGVTGKGTYPLTAANARGNFQVLTAQFQFTGYDLVPDSGTLEIEELTLGGTPKVRAKFSYTATHTSAGTKTITGGTHQVSGGDVYLFTGNGF